MYFRQHISEVSKCLVPQLDKLQQELGKFYIKRLFLLESD